MFPCNRGDDSAVPPAMLDAMPHTHALVHHDHLHLADRLLRECYEPVADLAIEAWRTSEPVPFSKRRSGTHLRLVAGDRWGKLFDCAWFRFRGKVPASAAGRPVVLLIDVNGELLLVDDAGTPQCGLTCVSSEYDKTLGKPGKREVPFLARAKGGETVDLWADGGCNDLFGKFQGEGSVVEARIAVLKPTVKALAYDVEVLGDLAAHLPEASPRRAAIMAVLDEVARLLTVIDESTAVRARAMLAPLLAQRGGEPPLRFSAIGHAHLDLAWLWPLRESHRKTARTIATALRNLERDPDYVVGFSQPQQFQWLKDDHPALFRQLAKRVAEGRVEPQGAMWVESDTNLVSGESLARQLLHGQRAWKRWFGRISRMCWLPDVFGYSAALPQLLRQAGVEWFQTTKLSWNKVNTFPHHTFRWRGLDGSEVLAHMPPEGTYNSSGRPRALLQAQKSFRDADASDRALMLFGIGDGGGGPGEEHLERLARIKDLAGLPSVEQETAERFFQRIDRQRERYAAWDGELYLERHQGTYTTQGRLKRWNRRLEWAMRACEISASRALAAGAAYPAEALERIWKEVLLHQFHDILPGSSITRVYTESEARSAALMKEVEDLTAKTDAIWLPRGAGHAAINDLSWSRSGWVQANGWKHVTAPALSAAIISDKPAIDALTATASLLENTHLRARFAKDGRLISLWDKDHQRETLAAPGNDLLCFADDGDAWDFPMDYMMKKPERATLVSAKARIDGPFALLTQVWRVGASTLTQRITLASGSRRLDFRTTTEWRERRRMLRVRFPTTIRAETARCEIQFGSIARPTHANTSWDAARFEVCAHSWVDLSEHGYGVALLNDGKYGHRLDGGVLDLCLLRSPGNPDPEADQGDHLYTYSLYPHAGDHVAGGVMREAHDLNVPLRVVPLKRGAADGAVPSLVSVDHPDVVVAAVKRSEDGDDLIVRVHESAGGTARARLRFSVPVRGVAVVNLLEEEPKALRLRDGAVDLELPPFAVRTLRLHLG